MNEVRKKIVAALQRTGAEADVLRAVLSENTGNIVQVMRRQGVTPAKSLTAACKGAQIPPAKSEWLRRPLKSKSHGVEPASCWKLLAAPLARVDGKLCIAFADPEVAQSATLWGLPEHHAHLALEEHIRAVLSATLGKPQTPGAKDPATPKAAAENDHAPIGANKGENSVTVPLADVQGQKPNQAQSQLATQDTRLIAPPRFAPKPVEGLLNDREKEQLEVTENSENLSEEPTDQVRLSLSELESFSDPGETEVVESFRARAGTKVNARTGNVSVLESRALDEMYSGSLQDEKTLSGYDEGFEDEAKTEALDVPSQMAQELKDHYAQSRQQANEAQAENKLAGQSILDPNEAPKDLPLADDAFAPQLAKLSRYRPRRELGRGGMAAVYLAERKQDSAQVALKVMDPYLARDAQFVERFRREAASTTKLNHPNIVRVLDDQFEEGGCYYIATEFVDGGTLRELMTQLQSAKPAGDVAPLMPAALVVEILEQALAGLEHAHLHQLVHRDLKPVNFMVSREGVLKLCDFGIAKNLGSSELTQAGVLFGTPQYMSPEQIDEEPLDGRSDLFSLGTLCLEMLSGENPFDDTVLHRQLAAVQRATCPSAFEYAPSIPPLLDAVLGKMMRRDRDERYKSAREIRTALYPLLVEVRRVYGNILQSAIQDPSGTRSRLLAEDAAAHEAAGRRALLEKNPRVAAFRFHCATRSAPTAQSAAQELASLRSTYRYRFDTPDREVDFGELKRAFIRKKMNQSDSAGDLLGHAVWARRAMALDKPKRDVHNAYRSVVGSDDLAPFGQQAIKGIGASSLAMADLEKSMGTSSRSWVLPLGGVLVLFALLAAALYFLLWRQESAPNVQPRRPVMAQKVNPYVQAMSEGERLFARGQLEEAEASFTLAISKSDDEGAIDALLLRGRVRTQAERIRDARTDFGEVLLRTDEKDSRHLRAKEELSRLPQ